MAALLQTDHNSPTMINMINSIQLPEYVALGSDVLPDSRQTNLQDIQKLTDQDPSSVLIQIADGTELYGTITEIPQKQNLKLQMEEFLDLSQFQCPLIQKKDQGVDVQSNKVDELNTPIFDMKNPFDFTNETQTCTIASSICDINQNQPIINYDNGIKTDNSKINKVLFDIEPLRDSNMGSYYNIINNKNSSSVVNSSEGTNNSGIFSPNNSDEDNANSFVSNTIIFNFDDEDIINMPTVKHFNDLILNNKENNEDIDDKMVKAEQIKVDELTLGEINKTMEQQGNEKIYKQIKGVKVFDDQNLENNQVKINSNNQWYDKPSAYYTPEESNCSSSLSSRSTPLLKLDIETVNSFNKIKEEINTPDVIETIDEIESTKDFNILEFINDEDLRAATDVILPQITSSETTSTLSTLTFSKDLDSSYISNGFDSSKGFNINTSKDPIISKDLIASKGFSIDETYHKTLDDLNISKDLDTLKKRITTPNESNNSINFNIITNPKLIPKKCPKRKRKSSYDDDEDYVPPAKLRSPVSHIKLEVYSDSEGESEFDFKPKTKRGRPPKRNVSISSEDYGDSPDSRYREMRDKNNEASRRSRLKRKMKEVAYEKEANELEMKNRKLKVQVAEMEKTVNNFRTSLMQLLLSKK